MALALLLAMAGFAACGSTAAAAEWRSEQPVAAGIGVPVPLGGIGEISCWQANRCLLITGGNEAEPAGLYAYDGTGWHLYSTVCGGDDGRIAWAGPDDFWTISDQVAGQAALGQEAEGFRNRSLCHFQDGRVVASYAQPLGTPTSYERMNAAACAGPNDCWFAGERLPGTVNSGAFHLHWDGSSLTAVPSLTEPEPELGDPGRAVAGLAYFQGGFFESVRVSSEDQAQGEPPGQPFLFHRLVEGSANPFIPVLTESALSGTGEAFHLAGDGGPSGEGAELWALAAHFGSVTALQLAPSGEFAQLPLRDPGSALAGAEGLTGVAAEPGGGAWVGVSQGGSGGSAKQARLAWIEPDGIVEGPVLLPTEAEGIARKGSAGPIACPALEQCWMATEEGWLFHLGPDLPEDTDPAMHGLITYRPPDEGLPSLPPDELPVDDSGAEPPPAEAPPLEIGEPLPHHRHPRALLVGLHQQVLHGTLLELTFTLRARAHVRLLAKRHKLVVAQTKRYTMAKGHRALRLRLDPQRWPTSLDLQVHPAGRRAGR